jgi:anti-anti-sigma regulatory factor
VETIAVTLRIEEGAERRGRVLRLSGRIDTEHLTELKAQVGNYSRWVALDLEGVTIVSLDAVRFLGDCEANGLRLLHCPPYVREWIRVLGLSAGETA